MTAQARLTPLDCPASLVKVSMVDITRRPKTVEMEGLRPCAVKVKLRVGDSPAGFEFLQNPMKAESPEGCVVVHESAPPNSNDLRIVAGKSSTASEVPVK